MGCMEVSTLLVTGEGGGRIRFYKAVPETVSFQEADGVSMPISEFPLQMFYRGNRKAETCFISD